MAAAIRSLWLGQPQGATDRVKDGSNKHQRKYRQRADGRSPAGLSDDRQTSKQRQVFS
jgi:hypothetical protein